MTPVITADTIAVARANPAAAIQASRMRGAEANRRRLEAARAARAPGPGRGANNRRLPSDPAERERVLIEAVRGTTTTGEAGERLGVTATRVQQLLRGLRDEGRLPDDIAAALAARRSGRRITIGDAEPGDPS
jgi:hypothetical protein